VSLVRPTCTLEYASSVWDPYQHNDIHRLEMVQRRAARYVTNRYHNPACLLLFLEGRSFDISLLDASTRTMLFFSLYIISNRHHATNLRGVVVSVSNISCSPSLNHLQSMDVILLVWVPYRAGIFQGRSYEGHVRFFFDRFVGDVYVPFIG
jgi:hypothetical protein